MHYLLERPRLADSTSPGKRTKSDRAFRDYGAPSAPSSSSSDADLPRKVRRSSASTYQSATDSPPQSPVRPLSQFEAYSPGGMSSESSSLYSLPVPTLSSGATSASLFSSYDSSFRFVVPRLPSP
jgi:hypothetical protein